MQQVFIAYGSSIYDVHRPQKMNNSLTPLLPLSGRMSNRSIVKPRSANTWQHVTNFKILPTSLPGGRHKYMAPYKNDHSCIYSLVLSKFTFQKFLSANT